MTEPTSTYQQQPQTPMPPTAPPTVHPGYQPRPHYMARLSRPAWATSELIAYVLTVLGVLLASAIAGNGDGRPGDYFAADRAWTLITYLTIAYLLSRAIAKAGRR